MRRNMLRPIQSALLGRAVRRPRPRPSGSRSTRLCSRKRPTTERTRIRSVAPGKARGVCRRRARSGRSGAGLRGRISFLDQHRSVSALIFDDDAPGRPLRAASATRSISCDAAPVQRERRLQQRACARVLPRLASCWNTASASGQLRVGGEGSPMSVYWPRRAWGCSCRWRVRVARTPVPPSRRVTSSNFACVFRPTMPYTTCAPSCLQPVGPVDVGLLVEARLQLDDHHHLLAAPRRLDQRLHQRRFAAGAVDGLLDRQHVGVVHRLAQELHHRLERLRDGGAAARRARASPRRSSARAAGAARPTGSYAAGNAAPGASAWSISWFSRPG